MRVRKGIVAAMLAAQLVCAGCNLLAPPPAALPAVAAPAVAPAAAAPAAAAAPHTGFLTQAFCGLRVLIGRIRARLGMRFPGLEGKPPVTAITDPANAESPTPAVKTAAEVKADEDAAPQKIKALRYLATIGCTECYPDIEKAMLAALDDCTESVRYEAVKAIRKTAGDPCQACQATRCCRPDILKRLREVAYDMRDDCCYKEPSARIRRLARLVLCECNGAAIVESAEPTEGPSREPEAAEAGGMQAAAYRPLTPGGADGAPLEVRWELLTAPRNRFESAERAHAALSYVRWLAIGQPVARPDGFDPKAVIVRTIDWTRPEQVSSPAIARALLHSPPDLPSEVIEDSAGWHLVLVRQRRPEQHQPFGASPVSFGGASLDRPPEDYGSAYLDQKLFLHAPPGTGSNAIRPTRVGRPDALAPDGSVPLTLDRPRRIPQPIEGALPASPPIATGDVMPPDTEIQQVNAIQPVAGR